MSRYLVEYTANLIGIDANNPYALKDIGEIENLEVFVEFVKENLRDTRLDYKNGLQKLNELKRMFSYEQNRERLEKAQSASQMLESKVRSVKNMLRQEFTLGRNPHWTNLQAEGKPLMTSYEIATLERIGSIHYVLRLCDDGVLQEEIEKKYQKTVLSKPKPKLENKTMQSLVNKVRI